MLDYGYAIKALKAHGIAWEIRDGVLWGLDVLYTPPTPERPEGLSEDEPVPTGSVEELKGWLGY